MPTPAPDDGLAVHAVSKTYHPYPWLIRAMVRTPIYEPTVALAGVDLQVRPGSICAVVGPNGAGKTTLFRIIAGLATADSGSVRVFGRDPMRHGREVRALIGWMPGEERSLFLRHTCRENLWFHGRLQGMSKPDLAETIPDILSEVGLEGRAEAAVFALSAGMRARLQLARALLHRPRLLILDEPTGAVDPVASHELLELIRELVARNRVAALVSSHRLEEIESLGARVALMDQGQIVFDGALEDFRGRWPDERTSIVFDSIEAARSAQGVLAGFGFSAGDDERTLVGDRRGGSVGPVLTKLGPLASAIVTVDRSPVPLRELLARLYRSRRSPSERIRP